MRRADVFAMKSSPAWRRLAAGLALSLATPSGHSAVTNRVTTTSASGQFIAHAPNALWSSAVCAFGEQIKRQWRQRLDLPDAWRDPILLIILDREADASGNPSVRSEFFQFGARLKYQITLVVPPPIEDSILASAIVETLCAEVANRDQSRTSGTPYTGAPIPVWLVEGLAQTVVGRPDQLLALVQRNANGSHPQEAMDVMRITRLPDAAAERALYRANAWLLTESFLQLPNGVRKMQQLLIELGATKTFARAFDAVYGNNFLDPPALEKWWSLQQAECVVTTVAENLSMDETVHRLDALLTVEIEPRPPFRQLWRSYEQPWIKPWLQDRIAGLETLRGRAHPLYRPVIAAYMEACAQLLDSKINRFRRATREADRLSDQADQRSRQIQETLDRIERAYAPAGTNAFQDFFRTLDRLEKFEQQRRNPISDYLDKFVQ